MNISKNIIRDLLPLYAAGEASQETRELVAEACAEDAALRPEVESLAAVHLPDAAPPVDLGIASLRRTQSLLRKRTFLVGFCYYFTLLPLVFLDRPLTGARLFATASILAALGGWVAFLRNSANLRDTGLQAARSWWPVLAWQTGAWLVSFSAAAVVGAWLGKDLLNKPSYFVLWPVWGAIMLLGRRLHQFREPEEISRPETLSTLAEQDGEGRQNH